MNPSENLTIDTPEQIALEFTVAGIGSRLLAMVIDTLIQIALYFLLILGVVTLQSRTGILGRAADRLGANWALAIAVLLYFCIYWGYFAGFEGFWKGQTPGKHFLKIRVLKDNGRPINVYEAIGRNIMRAIDALPTLYGVGLVTMAISKKNQRLGDMLAGTIVVHERAQAARPTWIAEAPAVSTTTAAPAMIPELAALDVRDLRLIEAFLNRRQQLQGFVRLNSADQIVLHIRNKAGIGPDAGEGPETFLERIARGLRDQARFAQTR
jgi:uncharacterized RDD family membrane protein YckC